jgi:hypothetical protein
LEAVLLARKAVERSSGECAEPSNWMFEIAAVLESAGRGGEFLGAARGAVESPWLDAAVLVAEGRAAEAAELYARIGAAPQEALARLAAAERHLAAGERARGEQQIEQALEFFRRIEAHVFTRQASSLLAAATA